jgi:hypothetical protein
MLVIGRIIIKKAGESICGFSLREKANIFVIGMREIGKME